MLLAVDVGNTQTVLGLFDGERARRALARGDRGRAHRRRDRRARRPPARASRAGLRGRGRRRALLDRALCSSAPTRSSPTGYAHAPLLVLGPGTKTGIPILFDDPREVGPDRIVNAVAARERYGAPCIVVDFGTSTNFDAVSADGEYVGGVIAPGIEISMDALFARAARLVKVDLVAPGDGDREDDGGRAPVRALLRLRRPGGRHRRAHAGRARRRRARSSPPVGWPS